MTPRLLSITASASSLRRGRSAAGDLEAPAVPSPADPLHVGPGEGRLGAIGVVRGGQEVLGAEALAFQRDPVRVGAVGGWVRTIAEAPAKREDDAETPGAYQGIRLTEVLGALSHALDMTEGQPMGHSVRTTMIGMRIGAQLGLKEDDRSALFYALLLKDLGCTSNAARLSNLFHADDRVLKHAHKLIDWTDGIDAARYAMKYSLPGRSRVARAVHALSLGWRARGVGREMIATRCERGASIARMLALPEGSAEAIQALDEHWDGHGLPLGLKGSEIPMLARIANLAQTVEVFAQAFDVGTAFDVAHQRRGRWFDPVVVDCLDSFRMDAGFWYDLRQADSLASLGAYEPPDRVVYADELRLDTVAEAFAKVIDAKSPFTARHSQNVAFLAARTAKEMGMSRRDIRAIRRAALLHDVGKLGVSNKILDKPSALDPKEMAELRRHTQYTYDILSRVSRFQRFAPLAAAHHERLDGSGYHMGLAAEHLGILARILAVADVCEALTADRPYRAAMPIDVALAKLNELVAAGHLCPEATEALSGWFRLGKHAVPAFHADTDSTSLVA
jgi:putative nucleotidyltransferase with HDIG domain